MIDFLKGDRAVAPDGRQGEITAVETHGVYLLPDGGTIGTWFKRAQLTRAAKGVPTLVTELDALFKECDDLPWGVDADDDPYVVFSEAGVEVCRILQASDFPCREEGTDDDIDRQSRAHAAFIAQVKTVWPQLRAALEIKSSGAR